MFDGRAFKKSDILPNSKMFIYLFLFESRECGRIVLTWWGRARAGEGQKTAAVFTLPLLRQLSRVEARWFKTGSASHPFLKVVEWEINTKNE